MVSIVIPAYNRADLLEKTLESVQKQKNIIFEVLVIDDNSNDSMIEEISRKYNVGYFKNKKNLGAQESRNLGVLEAKYDYISFLDSDDIWLSDNKLQKQYEVLKKHDDLSIVFTRLQFIDEEGNILSTQEKVRNYYYHDFSTDILKKDMIGTYSSVMVRKDDFIQCGMCNIDLPARQDWDLWIRLSTYGKAYIINDVLVQYRMHPNQISANVGKKIDGFSSLLLLHEKRFIKNNQLFQYYKHLFKIMLLAHFANIENDKLDKLKDKNKKVSFFIKQLILILTFLLPLPIIGKTIKNKLSKTYLFKGISIK